jgi:GNAT superfamily N-acetyltransferase
LIRLPHRHQDAIKIDHLKNHAACIPQLAKYSHDEWSPAYDKVGMTLGDAVASYAQRVNIDALPLALVAIYQDMVIGTGSLKLQDLDVRPRLTPWMGGIFVVKEYRGRGVATELIHRLIKEARRLSVKRLYLWTPSTEVLYANLGWVRLERFDYCGHEISVMQRELRSQANPLSQIRTMPGNKVA